MKLRGNVSAKRRLSGVYWRVGAAAALIWSIGYATASGQSSPGDAYSQMIGAVCRGYAGAVTVLPPGLSFARCVAQGDCFVSCGSSTYQCKPPEPGVHSGKE